MAKKLKIILFIILFIIIISVLVSIYLLIFNKDSQINTPEPAQNISQSEIQENEEPENKIINETNTENTISNTTSNTTQNVTSINLSNSTDEEVVNDTKVNIDELKKLMETYCVGLHRITYSEENLESNTILLLLAKQYFDTNSNKKTSLKVDSKYATTVENIHKYLSELTGNNYDNIEYLNSYKNYIGYSSSNRSYIYGKNVSELLNEEYECPKLELTNEDNGIYTAQGEVIRIRENIETIYDITLKFQVNSNYTYQKYQIVSLKPANKSFYPDNTVHLVENTEVE